MVDNDPDEMLGTRLDSALRAGLDLNQVDVGTLLQGSRRRAQRVRTQRMAAAVTAAVLVVGVPVGYGVLNAGEAAVAPPAALLPSSTHPAQTRAIEPTDRPNPTAAPSAVRPSAAHSLPTTLLAGFAFTTAELPPGLVVEAEANETGGTLVDGQVCDAAQQGPVTGRRWVWSTNPGNADALSVSLTVTGWAEGEASTVFTDATEATGSCTWVDPQTPHALPDVSAEQTWAATSAVGRRHYGRALVRVGDGIVGVQVQNPKGVTAAAQLADDLAGVQATRLRGALKGSS